MNTIDLETTDLRRANRLLQGRAREGGAERTFTVTNPRGAHALAAGLDRAIDVTIQGHVGYYCAGMNQKASVTIEGNAGVGVAENMMSGTVRVTGDASQSAGATAHGGLLVIEGNAASRCGISMKGVDIVVRGSVGHNSAFMAQAGHLVICGDADDGLGDSIYETVIFLRGAAKGLGADCEEKEITADDRKILAALLQRAGLTDQDPGAFRRYGSARRLYNFKIDNLGAY
ncbi:protein GlxC [Marivibrio halodurans]|uniref:Protein GlxC n=1 Tax=Marivibrio halodurans TaxID=2039722 RepID=A0A8J7S5T4_9PROT|nr:protein GlxC [Marivibrio halodurans]